MERFADLLISSVLLAGLYATMAYGLGLIYGVLRVVNLNHGVDRGTPVANFEAYVRAVRESGQ